MRGKNCTTRNKNNRVGVQRRKGGGAGGHRLSCFIGRQVQPIWLDFSASFSREGAEFVAAACLLANAFGVLSGRISAKDTSTERGGYRKSRLIMTQL
jgi:hypothetical protein